MRPLLVLALLAAGCASPDDAPPTPPAPPSAEAVAERFPAELAGLARASIQSDVDAALGASVSSIAVRYGAEPGLDEPRLEVFVTDYGTAEMSEMMGLAWGVRGGTDFVSGTQMQTAETFDGHPSRRTYDAERRTGRVQLLAHETLFVEVRGQAVPAEALDAAARTALADR